MFRINFKEREREGADPGNISRVNFNNSVAQYICIWKIKNKNKNFNVDVHFIFVENRENYCIVKMFNFV